MTHIHQSQPLPLNREAHELLLSIERAKEAFQGSQETHGTRQRERERERIMPLGTPRKDRFLQAALLSSEAPFTSLAQRVSLSLSPGATPPPLRSCPARCQLCLEQGQRADARHTEISTLSGCPSPFFFYPFTSSSVRSPFSPHPSRHPFPSGSNFKTEMKLYVQLTPMQGLGVPTPTQ